MKWRDAAEGMGAMAYAPEALASNGVAGQHPMIYNYRQLSQVIKLRVFTINRKLRIFFIYSVWVQSSMDATVRYASPDSTGG